MPSHKCHEGIGALMGINRLALRDANLLIDDPDKWFSERGLQNHFGLKHDDDRVFAMDIVRSILKDVYGDVGVFAADLHYAVDYVERWLDPELSRWMLRKMQTTDLYPANRRGFVHKYKGIWYPLARDENTIPITAYCNICKGVRRPINSTFCNECKMHVSEEEDVSRKMSFDTFLQAFSQKLEERKIDKRVVDFIGTNFNRIVTMIIEDRIKRGLNSIRFYNA
ncbi:MAG: hypothetical protein QXQ94_10860 [Candidatus Bathyarchaeia archaeon]